MVFLFLLLLGRWHSIDGEDVELKPSPEEDCVRHLQGRLFEGGSGVASIKDAPFVVALVKNCSRMMSDVPFCTGNIIAEEWVLSAAHCTHRPGMVIWDFKVIAGCDSITAFMWNYTDDSKQVRSPIDKKIHPYYGRDPNDDNCHNLYDVQLIKVEPLKFGTPVGRIGLWAKEWEGSLIKPYREALSSECTAYGWGDRKPDQISEHLRTANATALHGIGGCLGVGDDYRLLICSSCTMESSMCPTDSGGPLVCQGFLAGVTFCLHKCPGNKDIIPQCGSSNVMSSWIYICPMLSWIRKYIPDVPPQPISCNSPIIGHSLATAFLACIFLQFQY